VLLCLFSGPRADVLAVSERAGLPFERVLSCVGLGALAAAAGDSGSGPGAEPGQGTSQRPEPKEP